jgi:transposase
MDVWLPRRLTPAQLEERRLAAAARFPAIRAGRTRQADVAREFGVSAAAVCQWYAAWCSGGRRSLRARPKTGRPPQLTGRQWQRLRTILLRGAVAAGFDTERWTLKRIAAVVQREFGVEYHPRALAPALKAHDFTVQRPATRAKERDAALIIAWLTRDWAQVKKELVAKGARLPSWTRRVTRFGPASNRRGASAGRRRSSAGSVSGARSRASSQ